MENYTEVVMVGVLVVVVIACSFAAGAIVAVNFL